MSSEQEQEQKQAPGFLEVILSVLAAAFGVQNSKNRERDFSSGKPLPFILVGLGFTVLLVLVIVSVAVLVSAS